MARKRRTKAETTVKGMTGSALVASFSKGSEGWHVAGRPLVPTPMPDCRRPGKPKTIDEAAGTPCPCVAWRECDLQFQQMTPEQRAVWKLEHLNRPMTPYNLWMQQCVHLASKGLAPPDDPGETCGCTSNNAQPGLGAPLRVIGQAQQPAPPQPLDCGCLEYPKPIPSFLYAYVFDNPVPMAPTLSTPYQVPYHGPVDCTWRIYQEFYNTLLQINWHSDWPRIVIEYKYGAHEIYWQHDFWPQPDMWARTPKIPYAWAYLPLDRTYWKDSYWIVTTFQRTPE